MVLLHLCGDYSLLQTSLDLVVLMCFFSDSLINPPLIVIIENNIFFTYFFIQMHYTGNLGRWFGGLCIVLTEQEVVNIFNQKGKV